MIMISKIGLPMSLPTFAFVKSQIHGLYKQQGLQRRAINHTTQATRSKKSEHKIMTS